MLDRMVDGVAFRWLTVFLDFPAAQFGPGIAFWRAVTGSGLSSFRGPGAGRPAGPGLKPVTNGRRPKNAASRSSTGASPGTGTSGPNPMPLASSPRNSGRSAPLAQARAASHASAGKSARCPVAVARSQECTANSAICWLATKDFCTRPIGRSVSWLRSPACCQAARSSAAPARNAAGQSPPIPAAGASQSGRPPVAAAVN